MTTIDSSTRAIITGGAGDIGLATASKLLDKGAAVCLTDLRQDALEAAQAKLASKGGRVEIFAADVRSLEDVEACRDFVLDRLGGVDLVFNNAGITHYGNFEDFTMEEIRRVFDVNLMGVVNGCHVFLPILRKQGSGHLINISSMASISGMPRQSTYCASKAAVRALSESLSAELRGTGVGVTWLIAGTIATGFLARAETKRAETTNKLSSLMQWGGMSPERVAANLVRAVEKNQGELRLTFDCEAYYQMNRLSPRLLRASMGAVQRIANNFER